MKNVMMVTYFHMMDVLNVNINVRNNVQIVKKEFVMPVKLKDGIYKIISVMQNVVMAM